MTADGLAVTATTLSLLAVFCPSAHWRIADVHGLVGSRLPRDPDQPVVAFADPMSRRAG